MTVMWEMVKFTILEIWECLLEKLSALIMHKTCGILYWFTKKCWNDTMVHLGSIYALYVTVNNCTQLQTSIRNGLWSIPVSSSWSVCWSCLYWHNSSMGHGLEDCWNTQDWWHGEKASCPSPRVEDSACFRFFDISWFSPGTRNSCQEGTFLISIYTGFVFLNTANFV